MHGQRRLHRRRCSTAADPGGAANSASVIPDIPDDPQRRDRLSGSRCWARRRLVPRHPGAPREFIRAGGVDKGVTFADADPDLNDQIDAAYRDKYRRYGEQIIGGVVNPEARAATIKLVPR